MKDILKLLAQHNIEGGENRQGFNCHLKGKACDFIKLLAHFDGDDEIEICGEGGETGEGSFSALDIYVNGKQVCYWEF